MGQYYFPTNIDTLQYLVSHDYDNGLKLMEHSYIGNNFMNVIELLLSPEGSWYKAPLVWAGDYADEGNFLPGIASDVDRQNYTLYEYCYKFGKRIRPFVNTNENEEERYDQTKNKNLRYLCNWSCRDYVDLQDVAHRNRSPFSDLIIHPLSLLTSDGNGRGGGDFTGTNSYVGAWAGDSISMERQPPERFQAIHPDFQE